MKKKIPISVVIPTLGGKRLEKTLNYLSKSTVFPSEILIVLPKQVKLKLNKIGTIKKNIKLIYTNKKNQVLQRIEGFKKTKMKIVVQMDDDILVSKNCLQKLYLRIKNNDKIAIAPSFFPNKRVSKIYIKPNTRFLKLYHWLINSNKGFDPGTIALSGFNYGDEDRLHGEREQEWLPGAMIMHKKKNLILNNFYPYNFKKCYCEDLLHSLLLRNKNIKLFKNYETKIREISSGSIIDKNNFISTLKAFKSEFIIRYYIVSKFKFSKIRFLIYYLIYFIRILIRHSK